MKIFPTLNIRQGRVVPTVGSLSPSELDPMEMATLLMEQGATQLALVDVDAAHGVGHNRDLIARILAKARSQPGSKGPCIQVAGGIRSSDQAQFFLDQGATWLVVGTILHKSPLVVEQLLGRFQSNLTAAIDARGGQVHCSGWVAAADLPAETLAQRARAYGFRRILFVDIPEQEGAEPDFATAGRLVKASGLPVLMGGSISRTEHLRAARAQAFLHGTLVDALLFLKDPELMGLLHPACA
ncbi:MAG TPA: HisA/HisF-related TIM barrel protein [Holophagaceae bacterium]|nr:HisA/HisF-related TIM barrel protein [Holophagaceae bacterium]